MSVKELLEFCGECHKLYCYGAGRYGRETVIYLSQNDIKTEAFIVSEISDNGRNMVLDRPVCAIDHLQADMDVDGVILAVSDRFRAEMERKLSQKGLKHIFVIEDGVLEEIEKRGKFDVAFPNNQLVNVLLYHRVISLEEDAWNTCVSPKHFEEHMRYIAGNYPVVRFEDDWSQIREPSVVITFDDGYFDNYKFALPVLEKYSLPATFFVSTGLVGTLDEFWWDRIARVFPYSLGYKTLGQMHKEMLSLSVEERLETIRKLEEKCDLEGAPRAKYRVMEEKELKELAASRLSTIGAHTRSHSSLAFEPEALQREEMADSKKFLEELSGRKIDMFSYPFGYFNDTTVKIVKELGFKKAATVAGGLGGTGDPLRIPRNVVRDWDLDRFRRFMQRNWCVFSEVK